MTTTYRGVIDRAGRTLVTVEDEHRKARPLTHHVMHSPTGFSWGYRGSGPAELARCILWDYFGREPHPACYQAFKERTVATWPQDGGWSVTSGVIALWLTSYRGQKLADDPQLRLLPDDDQPA